MKKFLSFLMVATLTLGATLTVFGASNNLHQDVNDFVRQNEATTAAMSVSVFTGNDVLLEQHHGRINIANNVANHPEAVFEWGSATKLLVPVSALQLAERGLLDLNEDIRNHLPQGFLTGLRYDEPITMMHLLNHTAGFQNTFLEFNVAAREGTTSGLGEALEVFQPPQIFRPGSVTAYSNFGTALAGYVIERVSGIPFHAYVEANIFTPLGMTQTALAPNLSDNLWVQAQREHTHGYTLGLQSLGVADFPIDWYPAGSATGTLADFRKFGQALLSDNSILFQNPETLGLLLSPTSFFPDGTGRSYHGFWGEPNFMGHVVGHAGNTPGHSSTLLIDIENGFGAVVMTNQRLEYVHNRQMMNVIFGESDFSNLGDPANDIRVSGMFRNSQRHERGMFKFLGFLDFRPFFQQDDDTLSTPFFGTLSQVADGVYRTDMDWDQSELFFVSADDRGNVQYITAGSRDYIRVSWGVVIFEVVALLSFVVAGLYGLVMLIKIVIQKLRNRGQDTSKIHLGLYGVLSLMLVNFMVFAIGAFTGMLPTAMIIHGVLFILLSLAIIACVVILWLSKNRSNKLITPSIMGFLAVFSIIYWQLWVFWL
ncbi:MAG: beta-lactamase family protein [Defluviitaleaceae bacterium]|nr:beta-lactamase family protein [Defluviitaleaceae bacterium]